MEIIPVIDIKNGQAVHAVKGQRDNYSPVKSLLCEGSEPLIILQAFLDNYRFDKIYVADLNAITGNGNNLPIITTLLNKFPALIFWVDAGQDTLELVKPGLNNLSPVLGSENGLTVDSLNSHRESLNSFVFSLDFLNSKFLGDQEILQSTQSWPEEIILLNLDKVGSNDGPDFNFIQQYKKLAPNKKFYTGGGIRNIGDLLELENNGITGSLLATALHNKAITQTDLENL